MNDLLRFTSRINISSPPISDISYLFKLHYAHICSIPFENMSMKENASKGNSYLTISEAILGNRRGGICFEFSVLLRPFLEHVGFIYRYRLARLLTPMLTPATHQIFIISIEEKDWIFDVGYGAKGPRAPLLLVDGYEHQHSFLSSRVSKCRKHGWTVSVKENSKPDASWEAIYAFHDIETTIEDVEMAYFYTLYSSKSLLNTNNVASMPTKNGRISIRNNIFTEVDGLSSSSKEIANREELSLLLSSRFGINIESEKLPHM
ncbi:arylamine N-acetyltransferase [Pectobacterium colocasium]|uniref:arylamine N-acetyltransferase family protein n=1 Tax=Pectobacterium TaxID=122277 RepID=UPI001CD71193|nr:MULTISPECIES: arylamine N-acetyltransferase [Pectobacterium]UYA61146.1 hypothetical protein NAL19_3059 [Pectobacterium sp. F1-1]